MVVSVRSCDGVVFQVSSAGAKHSQYLRDWTISPTETLELPQHTFLRSKVLNLVVLYLEHYRADSTLPRWCSPRPLNSRTSLDQLLTEWERMVFFPPLVKDVQQLAELARCADYLGIQRLYMVAAAALAWYFHSNPGAARTLQRVSSY